MKIPEKYACYRRLYPKPRISYSLYRYWVKGNWYRIVQYLASKDMISSEAITKGIETHAHLAQCGLPPKVLRVINRYTEKPQSEPKLERKIEVDMEEFTLVNIADFTLNEFIGDYKTGSTKLENYARQLDFGAYALKQIGEDYSMGLLVRVEPIYKHDEIRKVQVKETKVYELSEPKIMKWEEVVYTIYNDICHAIQEGQFDYYLSMLD